MPFNIIKSISYPNDAFLGTPVALLQGKQPVSLLATLKYTKEGNEMKKVLIVLVTLVSLGFIASQSLACWWDGYWGGPTGGAWGGYAPGINPGGAYQNFLNDTAKLRQELAGKQAEYNALMAQPNPDPKRAGELSKEIAGIHDQLQAKAQASGLPGPGSYGAQRGGYRYGPGYSGWGCW